jgi:hypothetical protein
LKDCQSNWATPCGFHYPNRTEAESKMRYDSLPMFTLTKCNNRDSIPIVQWYQTRDGKLGDWSEKCRLFLEQSQPMQVPKEAKAVFYGNFCPMTTFNEIGAPSTTINETNWKLFGRSKLAWLGKNHPDLLHVRVTAGDDQKHIFGEEGQDFLSEERTVGRIQAQTFKYVVYAEGACGWADRLKTLMLYNSTIFLQETKCHEYYQELMRPYEHYVPVKGNFDDLIEKVEWARKNEQEAQQIAINALELQLKYLTPDAIQDYMNVLFDGYSKLMKYKPIRAASTEKYTGTLKTVPVGEG